MREIKFRAWDGRNKKFYYSDFSCVLNKENNYEFSGNSSAHADFFDGWDGYLTQLPITQFTGLHDKNGKEIYFYDFVKGPSGNIFQVIWYDEEMRIALKHKDIIYNFNVGLYEVIGNIYENPELIEVK